MTRDLTVPLYGVMFGINTDVLEDEQIGLLEGPGENNAGVRQVVYYKMREKRIIQALLSIKLKTRESSTSKWRRFTYYRPRRRIQNLNSDT